MASRPISPVEPTKKYPPPIQPNAHPYAIKTTSSALLSRSNSSPHSAHHARHNYIPSSPSRIPMGMRTRHRHLSPLSSIEREVRSVVGVRDIPTVLPDPPPVVVASSSNPPASLKCADEPELLQKVSGAEITPSSATDFIAENSSHNLRLGYNHDQDSRLELYAGLPPNPKQWDADQLTTYLEASFRSGNTTNGDKQDFCIADILECVRTRGLTGRELLRLTDMDLAGTPLSDVERTQLLERSRALRADVLRGRIYAHSYHSREVSDCSNTIYPHAARSCTPLHSIQGASVSVDDLRLLLDGNTSESEGALPHSPVISLHRSNSVSDASAQRYRDLARMRMRRRGKVKGLVETWERASTSGSECSGSEVESESESDTKFESISSTKGSPELSSCLSPALQDEPLPDTYSSVEDSPDLPQELPLLTPPPSYTHMHNTLGAIHVEEEEPSIEELLASSPNVPLRGARAWEADFGLGETVKRIPASASTDAGSLVPHVTELDLHHHLQDDTQQAKSDSVLSKGSGMRGRTGSGGKHANLETRRRVVTAIFTGPPSNVLENAEEKTHLGNHRHARGANEVVDGVSLASPELQNDSDSALRALEESIAVTRIQLEAFRLRLEKVEADTANQEAAFMRAQFSDSCRSPGCELKERRLEAYERATDEPAEPPKEEISVEGFGDRDVPGGWETMSLADIARTIVAGAVGWLFPYGRLGVRDKSLVRSDSRPEGNGGHLPPAKRNGRFPVARLSYSIILVSFAICAAVLRRVGFGRWVGQP